MILKLGWPGIQRLLFLHYYELSRRNKGKYRDALGVGPAAALALGLGACTTSGHTERNAAAGAAAGAVVGAVIGNNTGSGNAKKGAAIGAGVGAASGASKGCIEDPECDMPGVDDDVYETRPRRYD